MAGFLIGVWFLAIVPGEPSLSHAVPPVAGTVQRDHSSPPPGRHLLFVCDNNVNRANDTASRLQSGLPSSRFVTLRIHSLTMTHARLHAA